MRVQPIDKHELDFIRNIDVWVECSSANELMFAGVGDRVPVSIIRAYFSKWGDVTDCIHYVDPQTLLGTGRGRVAFKTIESAMAVVSHAALPLLEAAQGAAVPTVTTVRRAVMANPATLFVAGLKPTTTDAMVRRAMSQFGNVIGCVVKHPRCFGFVTFEDPTVADAMAAYRSHPEIDGKVVHVKLRR
jgi:hypothetical protein